MAEYLDMQQKRTILAVAAGLAGLSMVVSTLGISLLPNLLPRVSGGWGTGFLSVSFAVGLILLWGAYALYQKEI